MFISPIHQYLFVDIAQEQEPDYESVRMEHVGFVDPYAVEGLAVLKSHDGKEFHIRAFSGEIIKCMADMLESVDEAAELPSIYKMVSEICEENELVLVKVKIYESGSVLRANLYLTGRKDLVLRNYRASDAIALATLYKIPILVRKNLLKDREDLLRDIDPSVPG